MKNTTTKHHLSTKTLTFIIIGLIILVILGIVANTSIQNRLNHDRFSRLDTQSQKIYQSILSTSNGSEEWHYKASCANIMTGDLPTGEFTCTTMVSTQKRVTTIAELDALQATYYPIIDAAHELTATTQLDVKPTTVFGKQFVISSAEKHYSEKDTGIGCRYLLTLQQSNENDQNFNYGSPITGGTGLAQLSLECSSKAQKAWYNLN